MVSGEGSCYMKNLNLVGFKLLEPQNPSTTKHTHQTMSDQNDSLSIQFLCSLAPKSFDGKRFEFNEFITFLISKLAGGARNLLHGKTITNWNQFKEKLCTLHQDKNIISN